MYIIYVERSKIGTIKHRHTFTEICLDSMYNAQTQIYDRQFAC